MPISTSIIILVSVAATLGVGGAGIYKENLFRKKLQAKARTLADKLGLPFEETASLNRLFGKHSAEVTGQLDGHAFQFRCVNVGSSGDSERFTQVTLECRNPAGTDFKMAEAGFFTGLAKGLGVWVVEIGDQDFDSRFHVRSAKPEFASAVFNDEVRASVCQVWDLKPRNAKLECSDGKLLYMENGHLEDDAAVLRILAVSEALRKIAARMDDIAWVDGKPQGWFDDAQKEKGNA